MFADDPYQYFSTQGPKVEPGGGVDAATPRGPSKKNGKNFTGAVLEFHKKLQWQFIGVALEVCWS